MSRKLRGEFTFGFEFEGFARLSTYLRGTGVCDNYDCDFDDMECNSLDGDDYEEFYDRVNEFINHKLHAKKGRTHYDGSVKNYLDGYQSFEYSSTVYKFNAKNLKLLKNFFNSLTSWQMGVNETCGFHTHISYKGITEKDAIWIISQIACNPDWSNEVCYFNYDDSRILNFYQQRYANKDFLKDIKDMIESGNYTKIYSVINSDKYRVLRIHPQGTIEWRGPRDFLNLRDGFNRFTKKLTKIIDIFSLALEKKDLNGVSKKEFFDKLYNFSDFTINGCKLNPKSSKPLLRHGIIGLASDFNIQNISSSKTLLSINTARNIASKSEKNMCILCNPDIEQFSDVIFSIITYGTAIKYVEKSKKDGHNIPSNVIDTLLLYHSVLLPDLIEYIKSPSLEEIARYADKVNFNSLVPEKIELFVKTCIKASSKDNLIDVAMLLLNTSHYTYPYIVKCMEEGYFKDVDSSRILLKSKLYISKYGLYSDVEALKSLRDKGLIQYSDDITTVNRMSLISDLINCIENMNSSNTTIIDTTPRFRNESQEECPDNAPSPISIRLSTTVCSSN